MRFIKIFVYSILFFALLPLPACLQSESGATAVPLESTPTLLPTPMLQATAALPPTPPTIVSPEPSPIPTDWDGVLTWLSAHWQDDATAVSPIINALNQTGWIDTALPQIGGMALEFQLVDLSGDTIPEWVVTLHPPGAAPIATPRGDRLPGNLVIIGSEGVIFQTYAGPPQADKIAPRYLGSADFTGDGFNEAAIETLTCGASTCYGRYNIMSYHHGFLADIATADMQDKVNPATSIAVEVIEPVKSFFLEYTDGDNMTGIRRRAEWVWQNGKFEHIRLDVVDGRIPTNLADLETWLTGFYLDNEAQRVSAQEWLFAGRWMSGFMQIIPADMNGDGENEWIVAYHVPDALIQEIPGFHPVQPGGLWIVNSSGILYKAEDRLPPSPGTTRQATEIGVVDMTADGLVDVAVEALACDANACSGTYQLIAGHNGPIRNLLNHDHELSQPTRLNPTGQTMKPGSIMIAYQTADGVQVYDNWLWGNDSETLYRLTVDGD